MTVAAVSATWAARTPALEPQAAPSPQDVEKVSKQFESILLRQFLGESMKSLLQDGESGKVYGYLLTDALANSISEGGGLGLCSILQAQLGKNNEASSR